MEIIKRLGAFFFDIFQVIIFSVALFLFIYLLIMQPHKIKGDSMQPNFPNGECLLTEKVSYRFNDPKRGDVIVFKPPIDDDEYIKRIIALPGETISISNGQIYINGNLLKEEYLSPSLLTNPGEFLGENKQITIPEGKYFVMGDNRRASSDSRSWGLVERSSIRGKAWVTYWPINSVGVIKYPVYAF